MQPNFCVYTYWVSVQKWFAFGPLVATKWLKILWWFPSLSEKVFLQSNSNLVCTLIGECSELICFLSTLAKFWPSSGHKMTENGGFRLLSEKVFSQSNSNLVCTLIGWMFRIDMHLDHVGQILALQWPRNDWKWWFLTFIWKSIRTTQFKLCVYTYWASVQKWFAFGPLVATKWLKMVVSIITWKSIHATQFKLGVYIYWVSVQNWFAFCLRWPNFGPLVATKYWKWLFPTIIWKSILAIQFKLGVYTYWVNVQNSYALGPRWPNFGHLVATKWLKMVVSKHYLEKYPCNSIQTWCVHFLGECLE